MGVIKGKKPKAPKLELSTNAEPTPEATEDEAILAAARERFKVASEAWEKQRQREKEDLEFQIPELQWDPAARRERMGDGVTPGRPILSISKIDQSQQLILNQMRAADLGIVIDPVSEDADDDTAEMLQGLYRAIERTSRAELARGWAFGRAVSCGMGAYEVSTEYDPMGGHPLDQRIVIKRIKHQDGVLFDPAAEEPDFRDGEYAFKVSRIQRSQYRKKYPKAAANPTDALEWEACVRECPEWFRDGDAVIVRYWWKEHATKVVDGRECDHVTVRVADLSGFEVLDKPTWPGKWIPLIPVVGRELQPFDGESHFVGIVRNARDGQRLFNFAASTLVERMALEPKTPFIGAEGQFEGHKQEWKEANTRNRPFLEYKPVTLAGTAMPPPQRAVIDQSGMSLAMMALQSADQFIQATTAIYDQSLGKRTRDESGRAIKALQDQSDASTSHYLQSLGDVSMPYEATVVLDLVPHYYDRPGRVTQVLRGDDGKAEKVMLGKPFVMDPRTGRPMPAPMPNAPGAKHYDLTKGAGYGVAVRVGKAYQTRLAEGNDKIGELLAAKPELFPLVGDLWLRYQTWPGHDEMADRMARVLDSTHPGLREGKDGQVSPEQLQSMNQALQQQLKQAQAQMQEMAKALETEQAKQQATIAKAQMDAQAGMQKTEMDNAARLEMTRMQTAMQLEIAQLKAEMDAAIAQLKVEADTMARREEMAHDVGMAAAGGQSVEMTRDRGRETGREHTDEQTDGSSAASAPPVAEGE